MVVSKNGRSPAPGTNQAHQRTALQAHVEFFDLDGDGIIWPSDTYHGFRSLKFNVLLSVLAMLVIHSAFSYVTWGTFLPDPYFRLKVENMHRAKHGSDSAAYTSVGGFDEERFDSMFKLYSSNGTHLTFMEGARMVRGNRDMFDFFGWFAAAFEWSTTYLMLRKFERDEKGIKKEDVKALYNGSLFYRISGRKLKS